MADKHPYVNGLGVLVQVLNHLRKSFPNSLNADILKKLGFAPKNESYVLNTLRFLKLIDDEGNKTELAQKIFTLHDSELFKKAFSDAVKFSYSDLFSLHGEETWGLDSSKFITFFRQTDQSSGLVGTRQANTFKALASYAGHESSNPPSRPKAFSTPERKGKTKVSRGIEKKRHGIPLEVSPLVTESLNKGGKADKNLGLTVRIEINLPAQGDQETYDKIFKSIRENLLNG